LETSTPSAKFPSVPDNPFDHDEAPNTSSPKAGEVLNGIVEWIAVNMMDGSVDISFRSR